MSKNFFTDNEMNFLKETTLEELREIHDEIKKSLAIISKNPFDKASFKELKRLFHTITGTAGLVGFKKISSVGSVAEDIAESGEVEPDKTYEKLSHASEKLGTLINEAEESKTIEN